MAIQALTLKNLVYPRKTSYVAFTLVIASNVTAFYTDEHKYCFMRWQTLVLLNGINKSATMSKNYSVLLRLAVMQQPEAAHSV